MLLLPEIARQGNAADAAIFDGLRWRLFGHRPQLALARTVIDDFPPGTTTALLRRSAATLVGHGRYSAGFRFHAEQVRDFRFRQIHERRQPAIAVFGAYGLNLVGRVLAHQHFIAPVSQEFRRDRQSTGRDEGRERRGQRYRGQRVRLTPA